MSTPIQLSASSSASSGPSTSGGISGGTGFNIGGINFGYQPQTSTATGGTLPAGQTGNSGYGSIAGTPPSNYPLYIGLARAAVALIVYLKRR